MLKNWDSFVIFEQLPKENNRPTDKNSPNLVTLICLVPTALTIKARNIQIFIMDWFVEYCGSKKLRQENAISPKHYLVSLYLPNHFN
jgi:hypothetical protein